MDSPQESVRQAPVTVCLVLHISHFQVSDSEIDEMFQYADADQDGMINWTEFQTMINPHKPDGKLVARPGKAEKPVNIHPKILTVTSILKQSETSLTKNRSKVAPLEISETHVSASWTQIGLSNPIKE